MIWSEFVDWMQNVDDDIVMAPERSLSKQLERNQIDEELVARMELGFEWLDERPNIPMIIKSRQDFMLWLEYSVCKQLSLLPNIHIQSAQQQPLCNVLEPMLRVALMQNQFDCNEFALSLWPSLEHFLQLKKDTIFHFSKHLYDSLLAYVKSHDSRRLILILSPYIFDFDGKQLLATLDWSFSPNAADVTPDWVKQYQPKDRVSQFWLYKASSGNGLFMILYTKKCRFARCFGCNLPDIGADEAFYAKDLFTQVNDLLFDTLMQQEKETITEVFLSNNGSVFDDKTLPTAVLLYACIQLIYNLPNLSKIILETRTEYVKDETLKLVQRTISDEKPDIQIELVIGVEIADVEWRNKRYGKALTNRALAKLAEQLSDHDMSMRCYFMYKPLVEMTDQQAANDIIKGIELLEDISKRSHCHITMHINPTYVAIGTELDLAYQAGSYTPPSLMDVENMLVRVAESDISLHVGLSDEGLAVDGGYTKNQWYESKSRLTYFNMTQNFSYLRHNAVQTKEKKTTIKTKDLIVIKNVG